MSQENVEIIRGGFARWTEGGRTSDAGDDVIVVLHEAARIGNSGSLLERDVFQVWTLRDGLVVKWRLFETREEALEAAGLRA